MEAWAIGGLLLIAVAAGAVSPRRLRRGRGGRGAAEEEARQLLRALGAERAARQSQEAWVGALAGASGDPLLVVDASLRLLRANAAGRGRFGEAPPRAPPVAYRPSPAPG